MKELGIDTEYYEQQGGRNLITIGDPDVMVTFEQFSEFYKT